MKVFKKCASLVVISTSLIGCGGQSVKDVSISEIQGFLLKQSDIASEMRKGYQEILARENEYINRSTAWYQPKNKDQSCKVRLIGEFLRDTDVFWDGGCTDGYAYGLGRVFLKSLGGKEIIDMEFVSYYQGGERSPTILSSFDRVKNSHVIHAYGLEPHLLLPGKTTNGITTHLSQGDNGYEIQTSITNLLHLTERGYGYSQISWLPGNMTIHRRMANKNNDTLIRYYKDDDRLDHTFIEGPYKLVYLNNGKSYHWDLRPDMPINLSDEYLMHSGKVDSEIREAIAEIISATKKTQDLFYYYRDQACKENKSLGFISSRDYKQICGKYGYLSDYIEDVNRRQEALKSSKDREKWAREQENVIKREYETAQQANLQSNMNSTINRGNWLINGLNNSSSIQMYQPPSAIPPTYYNRVGNSLMGSDGTTCTGIGNSIVCR
ncbi:MAG: hypothetical protein GYB18_08440 [Oceanospirillales bacterium]|nr:hypothetical protein [Oceanospirillales bacterium]